MAAKDKGNSTKPGDSNPGTSGSGSGTRGWGATGKVGGGAVVAVAALTGLIFLPRELVDGVQNLLFGWLPEEWRDAACSVCSLCCCCGSCILALVLVYFTVAK